MAKDTPMADVQGQVSSVAVPIDRVGVKDLRLPLRVREKGGGVQHTAASVNLSVDLPAEFKGAHMSRFVEGLEDWGEELDYASFKALLTDVAQRLQARSAHARFTFPFFLRQTSPVSRSRGLMGYTCHVEGFWDGRVLDFKLTALVPVMTVCPCSLAISDQGAHSQRAEVRIAAKFTGFLWLEDLIAIGEAAGSSPVYTLLKREDEKQVTERAFANPTFVEDVVRNAAQGLADHPQITWFHVQVESFESIHGHSAFASIERHLRPGRTPDDGHEAG